MGHTDLVGTPIKKKRNGTGHPKCLVCALADVPAGAPLLKVYAYGSFGARFFWATITPIDCVAEPLLAQNTAILCGEPLTLFIESAQSASSKCL